MVLLHQRGDLCAEPFTLKEFNEWVAAGMPDDAPDEDADEVEMDDDEDDEDDDDEEDDDDDEGEEEEEGEEADLEALSLELKKGCRMLGLPTNGTRDELLALLKSATAEADDDDEDEDEDEDDEGESEDESEDESEEEEEEEPTLEEIEKEMSGLTEEQLKAACEQMGLAPRAARTR